MSHIEYIVMGVQEINKNKTHQHKVQIYNLLEMKDMFHVVV